jgi:glycosyltransferase involved in cell wall biosynthesis
VGLATAALSLVTDESSYEAIRAAAIDWAYSFSWEKTADRLMELALNTRAATMPRARPRAAMRAE